MKKQILLCLLTALAFANLKSQTIANQSWIQNYSNTDSIYNAPSAIDGNNNVIVSGYTFTNTACQDFVTIKYDNNGNQLWVKTYNGPANGCDAITGMAVDASMNIYVTGSSYQGATSYDYVTIKYDPNGNQLWLSKYNGTGNGYDAPSAIKVDGSGNVYVTGQSQGTISGLDYATVKYNSSGVQLWANRYNGTGNNSDGANAIVVSSNNRVFVTGSATGSSGGTNVVTQRLNPLNGAQVWATSFNGTFGGADMSADIVSDATGANVYITGQTEASAGNNDYLLIKYNGGNGVQQWMKSNDGYAMNDEATSMVLDTANQIIITGTSQRNVGDLEIRTIKYDGGTGVLKWTQTHDIGAGNLGVKSSNKIVKDFTDHLYVSGAVYNGANFDYLLIRYTPLGTEQWFETYDRGIGNDIASGLAVDNLGRLYITGQSFNGTNFDITTIKYDQTPTFFPPDFNAEAGRQSFLYYPNVGQIQNTIGQPEPKIKFYTNSFSPNLYFKDNSLSYAFSKIDTSAHTDSLQRIDMTFVGGNALTKLHPFETGQGYLNYFLQQCPNGKTNIFGSQRLMLPNIWNGVDLHYYSNENGLKYYFVVAPTANPNNILLNYGGASSLSLDTVSGQLTIASQLGNIVQVRPIVYQINFQGNPVPVNFIPKYHLNGNQVSFTLGNYNPIFPLIIEISNGNNPTPQSTANGNLEWGTFYGGVNSDQFNDVKTDLLGNVLITGWSIALDFPTFMGFQNTSQGFSQDVVILKFDPIGARVWATYYGSTFGQEVGTAITADASGNVFTVGYSSSGTNTFPTFTSVQPGAYNQSTLGGLDDGFLIEFNPAGNARIWATLFGGTSDEELYSIKINSQNNIYVGGYGGVNSTPCLFNKAGAYNNSTSGRSLIAQFDPQDNLVWGTLIDGTGGPNTQTDKISGMDIDIADNVFVTGGTDQVTLPIVTPGGAFMDNSLGGTVDGSIMEFNSSDAIVWSTYIGGSGQDISYDVNVDKNGNVFLTGSTMSSDFPVFNPGGVYFDGTINDQDIFVMKFGNTGNRLWGTFYGGGFPTNAGEEGKKVTTDANGNIYITGRVETTDFQTNPIYQGFFQANNAGTNFTDDAFILTFDPTLSTPPVWATFMGGSFYDVGNSITAFQNSKLYVVGYAGSTNSANNVFNQQPGGAYVVGTNAGPGHDDGFITRFDLHSIETAGINNLSESDFNFTIYPNPSNGNINLQFGLLQNQKIKIRIYDVLGKEIYSDNEQFYTGINTKQIDVSDLANGIYVVQIVEDNKMCGKKFIIQK